MNVLHSKLVVKLMVSEYFVEDMLVMAFKLCFLKNVHLKGRFYFLGESQYLSDLSVEVQSHD